MAQESGEAGGKEGAEDDGSEEDGEGEDEEDVETVGENGKGR
jgi:hypothetical protein